MSGAGHGRIDPETERRWLAACRNGDGAACSRVVRAYQDIALRTAYLMTNDRQAAEDVAQNAFLNAFRSLQRFDLGRPFRPWFLAILANEARMHLRAQRHRPVESLDGTASAERSGRFEHGLTSGNDADALLARLILDDERARVRAALAALEEPFRTAIVLHYFNDLSIDEIADATDTPAGTVKSRLFRGRQQLRDKLRQLDEPVDHQTPSWRATR
jgi:RNA polymerase sigma-70 factor (ECF subfamily)